MKKYIESILSVKLFLVVCLLTLLFFNFFDITLFKLTRSFHGQIFSFFKNIVDPLSDIVDPFNILLVFFINILFLRSFTNLNKIPEKRLIILKRFNCSEIKIKNTIVYYKLVSYHVIFSIISSGVVCHILKYILGVSRPKYYFLHGYERFDFFNIEHKVNSMPSGHTQAAFTISILFLIYFRRYYIFVFCIAFLMGISRIFMSMHFPSDLILGAYIGLLFPVVLHKIFFFDKLKLLNSNILGLNSYFKLILFRFFI